MFQPTVDYRALSKIGLAAQAELRNGKEHWLDWFRFWSHVRKGPRCWLWTGSLTEFGYGHFCIHRQCKRISFLVHRYVYKLCIGEIPKDFEIDHLCKNTACVNPLHLEAVSTRENCMRSSSVGSQNARKTHCPLGHPLYGENLVVDKYGYRKCLICKKETWRRWKQNSSN